MPELKLCGACGESLGEDAFSRKQWKARQVRRCAACTSADRPVSAAARTAAPPPEPAPVEARASPEPAPADEQRTLRGVTVPHQEKHEFVMGISDIEAEAPKWEALRKQLGIKTTHMPPGCRDSPAGQYHYLFQMGNHLMARASLEERPEAPDRKGLMAATFAQYAARLEGLTPTSVAARAKRGDVAAMVMLSDMYQFGILGTRRDFRAASEWKCKARVAGSAEACVIEALYYMRIFDPQREDLRAKAPHSEAEMLKFICEALEVAASLNLACDALRQGAYLAAVRGRLPDPAQCPHLFRHLAAQRADEHFEAKDDAFYCVCEGPGCTIRATSRKALMECQGCRTALYCSRQCQRAAWRAGHRDVCGTVRRQGKARRPAACDGGGPRRLSADMGDMRISTTETSYTAKELRELTTEAGTCELVTPGTHAENPLNDALQHYVDAFAVGQRVHRHTPSGWRWTVILEDCPGGRLRIYDWYEDDFFLLTAEQLLFAPPERDPELRFGVGDHVCAWGSDGHWCAGYVVDLNYSENDWPADRTSPYMICLYDPELPEPRPPRMVNAPRDSDDCVRRVDDPRILAAHAAGACTRHGSTYGFDPLFDQPLLM